MAKARLLRSPGNFEVGMRSGDEIKKAYRRLAMKYPPRSQQGRYRGAEQKFKEAKEAYEVLKDDDKRATYDQFGHDGLQRRRAGGPGGFSAEGFGDIFGDVFGDIFGGGGRRRGGPARCSAARISATSSSSSLETAVSAATDGGRSSVPTQVSCETCAGSAAQERHLATRMPARTCGGAGQVRMQQGFFSIQQTCPACKGAGTVDRGPVHRLSTVADACAKTQDPVGQGARPVSTTATGFSLSGEGEAGRNGGPPGDLYVEIRVERRTRSSSGSGANLSPARCPISYRDCDAGRRSRIAHAGRQRIAQGSRRHAVRQGFSACAARVSRRFAIQRSGDLFAQSGRSRRLMNLTSEQKDLLERFDETIMRAGGEKSQPARGRLAGDREALLRPH